MWKTVKLGDVIEKTETVNPTSKFPNDSFEYIDVSSVSKERLAIVETQSLLGKDAPSRARRRVHKNDVIFATVRPTLKRVAVVPRNLDGYICSTGYLVLRGKKDILLPRYLFYWMTSKFVMDYVESVQTGASYPAVTDRQVKNIDIQIPPLAEQQRIVAKLDAAFAEINGATELLQSKSAEVKKLKAAILDRNLNEILVQKPKVKLSAACERVSVGHVGTTSKYYCDDGVPFIRTQNVSKNGFDDSELKFITQEFHQSLKKSQLKAGDVLLSRVVIDEMRTAIVPSDYGEANCANVILIRPTQKLSSQFLSLLIQSRESQKYFMGVKKGAAQQVVNTGILKEWTIPLPTIEEQTTFEQTIKESFKIIENLNGDTHKKIEELTKLKTAILAQELQSEPV